MKKSTRVNVTEEWYRESLRCRKENKFLNLAASLNKGRTDYLISQCRLKKLLTEYDKLKKKYEDLKSRRDAIFNIEEKAPCPLCEWKHG